MCGGATGAGRVLAGSVLPVGGAASRRRAQVPHGSGPWPSEPVGGRDLAARREASAGGAGIAEELDPVAGLGAAEESVACSSLRAAASCPRRVAEEGKHKWASPLWARCSQ